MAEDSASGAVDRVFRYLQWLLIPLLGYAGVDSVGEWRGQTARAEQERTYRALTTKQVQQCLANAKGAGLQMSRRACEDVIERWYDGEPLSAQQHDLMSGWAFGDFEPAPDSSDPRTLVERREAGPLYAAETDGLVLLFFARAAGKDAGEAKIGVGGDATSLLDVQCPVIGQGAVCAVSRGQSWRVSSPGDAAVHWVSMLAGGQTCCREDHENAAGP